MTLSGQRLRLSTAKNRFAVRIHDNPSGLPYRQ